MVDDTQGNPYDFEDPERFESQPIPGAVDYSALWRDDATEDEQIAVYQELVDTGQAWRMEGHVGRTAMAMIEAGLIMLGERSHRDYWGNLVPSRFDVEPGTKGSLEYVEAHS
jgi:hypothetical protein